MDHRKKILVAFGHDSMIRVDFNFQPPPAELSTATELFMNATARVLCAFPFIAISMVMPASAALTWVGTTNVLFTESNRLRNNTTSAVEAFHTSALITGAPGGEIILSTATAAFSHSRVSGTFPIGTNDLAIFEAANLQQVVSTVGIIADSSEKQPLPESEADIHRLQATCFS
jgi:hypothetical protein